VLKEKSGIDLEVNYQDSGVVRGVTRESRRTQFLRRLITIRAQKNPNNITSTFFNTVHWLPKEIRCEQGAPNLLLAPGAIKPRYVPGCGGSYSKS